MEMDDISSSGSSHSFGHSYDYQAMDVSGDTVTTQTIDGDGIIELEIYPPVYDNDSDKMLLADALRLGMRLPTDHCFPGYYLADDGKTVVVSEVVDLCDEPVELAESSESLVKRNEEKEARRRANRAKPYEKVPPPRISEELVQQASVILDRLVATHSAAMNQPLRTEPFYPEPMIDLSQLSSGIAAHALEESSSSASVGARTSTGQGIPRKRQCFNLDVVDITAHSALYTTIMSWDPQCSEATSSAQDDDDVIEEEHSRGCRLGLETGSALSWVYKQGYREIPVPRQVQGLSVPLTEWDQSRKPVSNFDHSNQHMAVSFKSEYDTVVEYRKAGILTYLDGTAVAPVLFQDLVTLNGASPKRQISVAFLGALGVTRRLMLRDSYDGLLALSPRLSANEQSKLSSIPMAFTSQQIPTEPFIKQLRDLKEIMTSRFYMTFAVDWSRSSKLSLGGITRNLHNLYTWSPWMRLINKENLTWSLYLDSIVIHSGGVQGPVVDTLSFIPPPAPLTRIEMHFDTGCSRSHYTAPVLNFFIKNKLILVSGRDYYCRVDDAARYSLAFHFRSGCLQQTWIVELPATMLGEGVRHSAKIQDCSVSTGTVASTGRFVDRDSENIWGNKHMRSMAIGFDAERFQMQLGTAK